MLERDDFERYLDRYNARFQEFGHDPRTLGWGGGVERQTLRFKVAMSAADRISLPITSILDVGCGFGDLGSYLGGLGRSFSYTGVDLNPKLLDVARLQLGSGANLLEGDISNKELKIATHDLVIGLGLFGAKLLSGSQRDYIMGTVGRMFDLARFGVVVDFMTDRVEWQSDLGFHFPPEDAIKLATGLTSRFVLVSDYLPYEYSLFLFKSDEGEVS